jgi:hypothetical protein
VQIELVCADFSRTDMGRGAFGFVYDRGCLHSMGSSRRRRSFAARVAACLCPGGFWLTQVGSADSPPREVGPPRLTARELLAAVEPAFALVSLRAGSFDSDQECPAPAWLCLGRKRRRPDH